MLPRSIFLLTLATLLYPLFLQGQPSWSLMGGYEHTTVVKMGDTRDRPGRLLEGETRGNTNFSIAYTTARGRLLRYQIKLNFSSTRLYFERGSFGRLGGGKTSGVTSINRLAMAFVPEWRMDKGLYFGTGIYFSQTLNNPSFTATSTGQLRTDSTVQERQSVRTARRNEFWADHTFGLRAQLSYSWPISSRIALVGEAGFDYGLTRATSSDRFEASFQHLWGNFGVKYFFAARRTLQPSG